MMPVKYHILMTRQGGARVISWDNGSHAKKIRSSQGNTVSG